MSALSGLMRAVLVGAWKAYASSICLNLMAYKHVALKWKVSKFNRQPSIMISVFGVGLSLLVISFNVRKEENEWCKETWRHLRVTLM